MWAAAAGGIKQPESRAAAVGRMTAANVERRAMKEGSSCRKAYSSYGGKDWSSCRKDGND